MDKFRLFVSSPQAEFREERRAIAEYVRADPLLGRYFTVFLFEEQGATDETPERRFIEEVDRCDVYVGLFGETYGRRHGRWSSTEREFDRATEHGKQRLVFVKQCDEARRESGIRDLIRKAEREVVRGRFSDISSLRSALYAALVGFLAERRVLPAGPFERHVCHGADWRDIDGAAMDRFVRAAREKGGLPPGPGIGRRELLTQLDLLTDGLLTNAAILLFGSAPHRFIPSAEIKCVHILGLQAIDPIQTIEIYQGNMMSIVDAATTFVMSRLDRRVGERSEGPRAPRYPEIPVKAITEALVNAVAHRDYTSAATVQVTLFHDRLQVYNPGELRHPLTVDDLFREHRSVARNRTILRTLSRTEYVEEIGTGTVRMADECRQAGLPPPKFVIARGFVAELSRRRRWDMRHKGDAYRHIEDLGKQWREDMGEAFGRLRRSSAREVLKMEGS